MQPLARIVESELQKKLGMEVRLHFKDLQAADVGKRSASFKKLVEGGMSPSDAVVMASLMELQGTEN